MTTTAQRKRKRESPGVGRDARAQGKNVEFSASIIRLLERRAKRMPSPNTLAVAVLMERMTGIGSARWPQDWHDFVLQTVLNERRRRGEIASEIKVRQRPMRNGMYGRELYHVSVNGQHIGEVYSTGPLDNRMWRIRGKYGRAFTSRDDAVQALVNER